MEKSINVNYKDNGDKDCPATSFRKYIDDNLRGRKPKRVFLSDECVDFLANDNLLSHIGNAIQSDNLNNQLYENNFEFFWRESEIFPSLTLKVKIEKNTNKFILTYMKEDAGKGAEEFIYDIEDPTNSEEDYIMSYPHEALDDLVDISKTK